MKKYLNIISIIMFGIVLMIYILFFNGTDLVPDEAFFPVMISGSVMGVVLSWFGPKGVQETSA
ncbi:hypothetical protein FZC79_13870 [Rossellomorea vietnamensis]|uniref:Uncharacterized protein n=1 Tax=Rossellomorea vietnamensis TaxID=218284 RepID=A0A5D4KCS2_9BACI|nr:hypothetical protein [Rossellomorea vietnamensis]TYR74560.1 hypothetical protein FZC79_13870 [Rossellomorea vietnamensis]